MSIKTKREKSENPRTKRVREIALTEGVRLMVSEGGEAVTARRISEATGVARSAIYRHWPNQPALLLAVVERGMAPHRASEVTGDFERDLHTILESFRTRLGLRPFRQVFATLLSQANRDDAFIGPQRRLVDGLLMPVREVILGAVERGELPSAFDVESACAQLTGPLLLQHVMLRAPIEDSLIARVVRGFLAANGSSEG